MKRRVLIVGIMTMLCIILFACTASAESGTYRGIDWDLTDGVLTLGNGGTQAMTSSGGTRWTVSNVTSVVCNGTIVCHARMAEFFRFHTALVSANLSGFDTSNVTNMQLMFGSCSRLTSLDLSGWNTSNVTIMDAVFYDCSSLTSLDLSGWNTSNVTSMGSMFGNCKSLTSLNVSGFKTSNVTHMGGMFSGCSRLISLDLSGWDTSNVTIMGSHFLTANNRTSSGMFENCGSLVSLNLSGWNTGNVVDMGWMFYGCVSLTSLDVSGFNTSNVTDMSEMFYYCKGLTSLDLSEWDTSKVTSMYRMFYWCENLASLDLSAWDTSNVTLMNDMFNVCDKLKEVTLGDKYKTFSVSRTMLLPTPSSWQDGVSYTGKWIREDRMYGPFISAELRSNYNNAAMSGKWIWEPVPTDYTLRFSSASYPGAVGEMAQVTTSAKADYQLVANQYGLFGFVFDHWDDGKGHTYADQAIVPANTYNVGDVITLNLVMTKRDTSVTMQDGSFDFNIKGNEKALFQPIPANTTYQVYEQTPFGWNLIKQSNNAGTILPDEESEALFLNQYDPLKATVRFAGTKLMDESAAEPGSYSFLLYEDDALIDITSVSDGGLIAFQPITYDRAGVHNYTIREVIGSDNTVEYDTHVEGITVTVESDSVGHLSVDIQMDEDQILFKNESKPGMLTLRKAGVNNTDENREGIFYYEVQFVTQNGQPYELAESELSYEEREGEVSEYPDLQPVEKQKYTLTVAYQRLNLDGTVKSEETSAYEYYSGDMFELNDLDDSGYRYQSTAGLGVMRVGNVFKGVMSNGDNRVELRYEPLRTATIGAREWHINVNSSYNSGSNPLRSATVFARNESYASVEDLPAGAKKIDDGQTACSIYFWIDGTDAYWWSDAETMYMPTSSSIMFYNCSNMTSLDLSGFDTSKVMDMSYMFQGCNGLTSLDVSNFDTSNVTTMQNMFYSCNGLTSLDVSNFNTSKVTNMQYMFSGCSGLTSLDFSGFDTLKVTNMGNMFDGCKSLTSLDLSSFDTTQVTDMGYMFNGCTGLTLLDLSRFNTSKVTSMSKMFSGCSGLTSLDLSGFNTSKVTSMLNMFRACSGLTSLDVSKFGTSKVTNMEGMFYNCSGLTSLDVSKFNTSSVTSMKEMFYGCSGLTFLDVSEFNTSSVTNINSMFYNCSGLTSLNVSGFNTSNVTSMSYMFARCSGLTSLDLSGWNTSKVTAMRQMFERCSGLTSLDVSMWDTSNVTDIALIFDGCSSLTSLDLSRWNTSNVTDMNAVFSDCRGLTFLDVSGWNTSKVKDMRSMFSQCKGLKEVVLGENNVFKGSGTTQTALPWPPYDVTYTRKWIREDGTAGPFTSEELRDNYTSDMAGTWIWEVAQ